VERKNRPPPVEDFPMIGSAAATLLNDVLRTNKKLRFEDNNQDYFLRPEGSMMPLVRKADGCSGERDHPGAPHLAMRRSCGPETWVELHLMVILPRPQGPLTVDPHLPENR